MKNLIKLWDFYGTEFHWYFDNKPKYYTSYGGILSIMTILCCIAAFIIFGFEDFEKLHPISSISNIPPLVHKNIKFGKEKLCLPWRIMDYGDTFINHKGILYPRIYYFTNKYNNKTGIMETYYDLLNYTLCNETSMKNLGSDFLIDLPLDKLFCIDMEDLNMGGSWNSDYVNYIRLDLNLCENGKDYNESDKTCTKYDYLNSLYGENNNWFFELLYPTVQFQPNNKTMPILVLYTSYYYGLSTYSNKIDRVYLQEHIFEDEQGWIFEKQTNITYWGVSSIKPDYYKVGVRDIFRYGSSSRLYSLKIYLDYGTVFYTRKYKKLYEIFSEVFPIMKGITILFSLISEMINKLKVTKKINEYIIGTEINLFKKNIIEQKQKNGSPKNIKFSYNLNLNNNKFNINFHNNSCKNNNSYLNSLKDSSQLYCLNNNNNKNGIKINNLRKEAIKNKTNKLSIIEFLKAKPCNTINVSIINSDIFDVFHKKPPNFPLSYYFLGYCLNKIITKKNSSYTCISQQFDISFNFYTHLIDITSYISLYKQFESIKKYLYNNLNIKNIDNNNPEEISLNKKNDIKVYNRMLKGNLTFDN